MRYGAHFGDSGMIQSILSDRLRKTTASAWIINWSLLFATICASICSFPSVMAQGTSLKITSTLASASQLSGTALPTTEPGPTLALGPGDVVNIQVYGRPELSSTSYVADDGTLQMPLAGAVQVSGLSPAEASQRLADALKAGKFLVNPQVSIILSQFRSQQVSVLGDVRSPARFPVEARTTVFDLLALAGGITESGADVIYLLRPDKAGHVSRYPIDLKGLTDSGRPIPTITLRGGDTVFVPRAEQFYISGEVAAPNMYRIEPGMTVLQAMSRGGGVTPRGSENRVEIRRRLPDNRYVTVTPQLTDPVLPNDVIRVKERIF